MMDIETLLGMIAAHLPCRTIRIGGEVYLQRFYLSGAMPVRLASLWPENSRPSPARGHRDDGMTHYLHRFWQPDPDRHLHNHPWRGRTTILSGRYRERRIEGVREFGPGEGYALEQDTYHSIVELMTPTVWTLFSHGPKEGNWGFWVDGEHVPWREYDRENGCRKEKRR